MLVAFICVAACILPATSGASGSSAYLSGQNANGNAVDAKGVRRYGKNYPGRFPPWITDRVKAVGPEYSQRDRQFRNEGTGIYRLSLDLKTGLVIKATVLKSAGVRSLDVSALFALRQWTWKPGKWREIDMPVTFTMNESSSQPLPPGAIPLPNPSDR